MRVLLIGGSGFIGPYLARTLEQQGHEVIVFHRGRSPVFLVPVACEQLVKTLYGWGARNCEIHFCQVRGKFEGFDGVAMPTFMPETG